MQDRPDPAELVKAVAGLMQNTILAQSTGRTAFEVRVAINALELVARELSLAAATDIAEHRRLEALLGQKGSLAELNRELCTRLVRGSFDLGDARLISHLWATTMEKLAVDQPAYAAYRDELQRNKGSDHGLQPSP